MSTPITHSWPARVAVVAGDPEPRSRTLRAATYLAAELVGRAPDLVVDLGERSDVEAVVVEEVASADLVVVASPTRGGGCTQRIEAFLGRFPADALSGIAVPLMLGADPGQALAPDVVLRPALARISRVEPLKGLYVVDGCYADPAAYAWWLGLARPVVGALLASRTGVPA